MRNHTTLTTLAIFAALHGCTVQEPVDCGNGEPFEHQGKTLCMYQQPVLIEEGFSCPPDAEMLMPTDGGGVCAPGEFSGDPDAAWEAWAAQNGDTEGAWEVSEHEDEPVQEFDEFDPEFVAVVEVLRRNCLLAGCHGISAESSVYTIPTGGLATPAEVEGVLSSPVPTVSGNRLVVPAAPEQSEIYLRITKSPGDPQLMGAGTYGATATPLSEQEIATIEAWIRGGARYRL